VGGWVVVEVLCVVVFLSGGGCMAAGFPVGLLVFGWRDRVCCWQVGVWRAADMCGEAG